MRDQWQLALLKLLLNDRLVVALSILAIVHWSVHFEIDLLVADKVVFEYLLAVLLLWMLFHLEVQNLRRRLPIVVHLELVGLREARIGLVDLEQVNLVFVSHC